MQKKFNFSRLGEIWLAVLGSSVIIVLVLALLNRITGLPLFTQSISLVTTNQENLFTARGEAKLSVVPDQAVLNLGVTVTDRDVQSAQNEANRIMNQLQADLVDLGVEKKGLQTNNYSLYPNYDWSDDDRRIVSYTVDNNLRVTLTNFELINQVIDTATADGVNQVGNISFTLSDSKRADLQKQARQQAIEQAKQNAEQLANLTGIRLGNIINVSENSAGGSSSPMYRNVALGVASEDIMDFSTDIQAGETTYTYYVTLSYQTL